MKNRAATVQRLNSLGLGDGLLLNPAPDDDDPQLFRNLERYERQKLEEYKLTFPLRKRSPQRLIRRDAIFDPGEGGRPIERLWPSKMANPLREAVTLRLRNGERRIRWRVSTRPLKRELHNKGAMSTTTLIQLAQAVIPGVGDPLTDEQFVWLGEVWRACQDHLGYSYSLKPKRSAFQNNVSVVCCPTCSTWFPKQLQGTRIAE